jgi:hypothetical protein
MKRVELFRLGSESYVIVEINHGAAVRTSMTKRRFVGRIATPLNPREKLWNVIGTGSRILDSCQ